MPSEHRKPAEAREIPYHILGQRRRQTDQRLILGQVPERQDGHEGPAVQTLIAATKNPGGVERLCGSAASSFAHCTAELLYLRPWPDLDATRSKLSRP